MNKKKDSVSRTLPAVLILFAALMLAALLPLRLWQQMNVVEADTGFWTGGGATIPLLYVLLGVLFAVPIAASFVMKRRTALDLTRKRRIVEGIFAILVAAAMIWDAFAAFRFAMKLFLDFSHNVLVEGLETQASSPVQYYIRSGAMACLFEGIFGVLGALFFIDIAAVDVFPKNKKIHISQAMALAPLIWAACRILRRFSRTISYLRVSDLFLGLLMLAALLLFLLYFAQLLGSVNGRDKESRLFAAGIPAAVLSLVCFVPRFITYTIMGYGAPEDALVEWCDLALGVFILVFLAGRIFQVPLRPKRRPEDDEDESAAEAAAEAAEADIEEMQTEVDEALAAEEEAEASNGEDSEAPAVRLYNVDDILLDVPEAMLNEDED